MGYVLNLPIHIRSEKLGVRCAGLFLIHIGGGVQVVCSVVWEEQQSLSIGYDPFVGSKWCVVALSRYQFDGFSFAKRQCRQLVLSHKIRK